MVVKGKDKIEGLLQKGVTIPSPQTVFIGKEVSLDRISGDGVVLHPGSRIRGKETLIMAGAKLGYEGPVTIEDCQVGPSVELRGGFFRKSVFLEKASMGYGAQIREGCILEEESSGAHSVGLKQTILFPFVTLGSLINFCDCFMAGGTSRKNHSEVGSSYIHFNYTANQDKATPSLIGDVPRGVMLNQPPIFLGGQGALVGPVQLEYGTVIAAGVVCRKDVLERGRLVLAQVLCREGVERVDHVSKAYPGVYWYVKRRLVKNVHYIANLVALFQWYLEIRPLFLKGDAMATELYHGLVDKLQMAIEERIKRFKALAQKMPESAEKYRSIMKGEAKERLLRQKQELFDRWQDLEGVFVRNLENQGDPSIREPFVEHLSRHVQKEGTGYVRVLQGLDRSWSAEGTKWLQGIVGTVKEEAFQVMPSFK
ncbi:MAG: UDP-N-acetylglucosamine pyrophosphorylase [Thermodesulfobacteriota bacterium]|nr:UDP-N-acetylglucosamine pyrophosphorylase [Thermodesulfobacteriota bacterium]